MIIDGIWKPTAVEASGRPLPQDLLGKFQLRLKDGKYVIASDEGFYKIEEQKDAAWIDVTGTSSSTVGKTIQGIVRRSEDTLTLCCDPTGRTRPAQFTSSPKNQYVLISCKLEKHI